MPLLQFLLRLPWLLLLSTAVLVFIGALALYSASEGSWSPWAERQLLRAAIGTVLLFLVAFIPTRWLYNWSYLGIILIVLVLVALPFIGIGLGQPLDTLGPLIFSHLSQLNLHYCSFGALFIKSDARTNAVDTDGFPVLVLIAVPFSDSIQPDLGTSFMLLIGGLALFLLLVCQAICIGGYSGLFGCSTHPLGSALWLSTGTYPNISEPTC